MSREARHSSSTAEHYTPKEIVEAARHVLGTIDLDPASSTAANRVVQAKKIFTKRDDGLSRKWYGRVFLNPPGGAFDAFEPTFSGGVTRSSQVLWWDGLVHEYERGRTKGAIFISFSVELLQTAQMLVDCKHPMDYVVCFPRKRLAFDTMHGRKRMVGKQPTHASMIVYLPMGRRVRRHAYGNAEALQRVKDYSAEELRVARKVLARGKGAKQSEALRAIIQAAEELQGIVGKRGSASARVAALREWVEAAVEPWPQQQVAQEVRQIVGHPGWGRLVDWGSVQRFKEAFEQFGRVSGALKT